MADLPPRDPPAEGSLPVFKPCQGTSQAHIYPGPSSVPLPPLVPIARSGNTPRELRNKVERERRQNMNRNINQLAAMLPAIRATMKKVDKNDILRLAAHYLRANNYVFANSSNDVDQLRPASVEAVLQMINGFLITVTYKGLIVVISKNVEQYLGYSEIDLLGESVFSIVHHEDHAMLREQLMPDRSLFGPNGELIIPNVPDGAAKVAQMLANDKRSFSVRFKMPCHRTEPAKYVTCHIEGCMRMSDMAGTISSATLVRRARARTENPFASGNDIVFIGAARPTAETFITERQVESFRMEYWTRHSVDGEIIQCETHIALVTGYLTTEVCGVNAMNFMHKDDVPWVVMALREMYEDHRLYGESCYRLITKCGNFVYMKTRGSLEVNPETKAVTSFICTNTVVDEDEGIKLLLEMKNKFKGLIKNTLMPVEDKKESTDINSIQIEDPRKLETVILHLVTDLPELPLSHPSSQSVTYLSIIPPKKEKIVSAIYKIRTIFKFATESHLFMQSTGMSEVKSTPALSTKTINDSHEAGHGNTRKKKLVGECLLKAITSQRSKTKTRYLNILNVANAQPRRLTLSHPAVNDKDKINNNLIDSDKIEIKSDNTRLVLPEPKQRAQTNGNVTANGDVETLMKSPIWKQQPLTNNYLSHGDVATPIKSPIWNQQPLTNNYISNGDVSTPNESPIWKQQPLTNNYISHGDVATPIKSPIWKQQSLTNNYISHGDVATPMKSPIWKQQPLTNIYVSNGDVATPNESPIWKQQPLTNNYISHGDVATPMKSPIWKQQPLTNNYISHGDVATPMTSPIWKQQPLTNNYVSNGDVATPNESIICKLQALTNKYISNGDVAIPKKSTICMQQALTNNNISDGEEATHIKPPFSFYIFKPAEYFSGVKSTSPLEPKSNFKTSKLLSENREYMYLDEIKNSVVPQVRQCTVASASSSSADLDNSGYTQFGSNQLALGIKGNNYCSDHNNFTVENDDINSSLLGDIEHNEEKVDIQAITLFLMEPNSTSASFLMDHEDLEGVFQRMENEYADRNKENIQL